MPGRQHFSKAMGEIHQEILRMGVLVEEALETAKQAFVNKDLVLAEKVISQDEDIDEMQLLLEDRCTLLIATEQPVATDLRVLLTAVKIVSSLERMGDHAVHLAKTTARTSDLSSLDNVKALITPLIEKGNLMVKDMLTALANHDPDLAREIAARDDEIDDLHAKLFDTLINFQKEHPEYALQTTDLLFLVRYFERLCDHVTHICEWIVLRETGKHAELS